MSLPRAVGAGSHRTWTLSIHRGCYMDLVSFVPYACPCAHRTYTHVSLHTFSVSVHLLQRTPCGPMGHPCDGESLRHRPTQPQSRGRMSQSASASASRTVRQRRQDMVVSMWMAQCQEHAQTCIDARNDVPHAAVVVTGDASRHSPSLLASWLAFSHRVCLQSHFDLI